MTHGEKPQVEGFDLKSVVNVELLKQMYEKLKVEYEQKLNELNEVKQKLKVVENLMIQLGLIEKPVTTSTNGVTNGTRGDKIRSVVEYIEGLPSGTEFRFKDIVEATGMSRGTVWNALKKLEAEGKIKKVGNGVYVKQ